MTRIARILLVAVAFAVAVPALPAAAAQWREFGRGSFSMQVQRERPGGFQRAPRRDFRPAEPPPQRDVRRERRLTEEERRDLRRDLDRANREIYKRRR